VLQETIRLADLVRTFPDYPVPGFAYRDISGLLQDPEAFHEAIDQLAARCRNELIDVVVGIEPHGYLFAAPLAYLLKVSLVLVRTQGRIPGQVFEIESYLRNGSERIQLGQDALQPGMRVLIVEDILATGRTIKAACELVREAGGIVAGVACLVELAGQQGRERLADYPVFAVIRE